MLTKIIDGICSGQPKKYQIDYLGSYYALYENGKIIKTLPSSVNLGEHQTCPEMMHWYNLVSQIIKEDFDAYI